MKQEETNRRIVAAAETFLGTLEGIRGVCRIERETIDEISRIENHHDENSLVPFRSEGILATVQRDVIFALLKDGTFRSPKCPTVLLAEESDQEDGECSLHVNQRDYLIIGEEVTDPNRKFREASVLMGAHFVLFPERRKNKSSPAIFLIPPLGFQELEGRSEDLKISRIMSVSPSPGADEYVRKVCKFAPDPELATLLVGFDIAGER